MSAHRSPQHGTTGLRYDQRLSDKPAAIAWYRVPGMRCEILGPWGDEEEPVVPIILDVDMDLFIRLPDTSIYNENTGHLPSA